MWRRKKDINKTNNTKVWDYYWVTFWFVPETVNQKHYSDFVHNLNRYFLIKVKNRTMCAVCSKLTIKKPEGCRRRSAAFLINIKQISHIVLIFPLFTLNEQILATMLSFRMNSVV